MRELPTIKSVAKRQPGKDPQALGRAGLLHAAREICRRPRNSSWRNAAEQFFPNIFDDALALPPGIRRYTTAGAVCSIRLQPADAAITGWQRHPRADAHLRHRTRSAPEKETNATALANRRRTGVNRAKDTKTKNACSHLNQSLMELGALVCTPRNPQCTICPVKKLCVAYREDRLLPNCTNSGKRQAATARRFMALCHHTQQESISRASDRRAWSTRICGDFRTSN